VRRIVEAAGGTTENILKISVYVRDKNQREHINKEWLAMFPDPHSRPARHTFQTTDMAEGTLVSCDMMAVFS
jgi:enamine deaminase RidA (YjgF/YER057c/UK114 family)